MTILDNKNESEVTQSWQCVGFLQCDLVIHKCVMLFHLSLLIVM